MFCCNADGSDLTKLWFIGHTKRRKKDEENEREANTKKRRRVSSFFHRCFEEHNWDIEKKNCEWRATSKARMNYEVMMEWLIAFNDHVKRKDKFVLLLMDNHSSHIKADDLLKQSRALTNVEIHFLPPNTASKLQPLDQGIIKSFKCRYSKKWLSHVLNSSENGRDYRPDLLQAVSWSIAAWEEISVDCVINCWRHTGFMKPNAEYFIVLESPPEEIDDMEQRSISENTHSIQADEAPQDSESLQDVETVERNTESEGQKASRDSGIEELGAESNQLAIELRQENIVANAMGWDKNTSFIGEDMHQNPEEVADHEDDTEQHTESSNVSQFETSGSAQLPVPIGADSVDSDGDFVYQSKYDPQKILYMADYMMGFLKEAESLEHERSKGILFLGNVRKRAMEMRPPSKKGKY
ncbi:hypothetical protein OXX80_000563 [Metschnikowia pulcherrima]